MLYKLIILCKKKKSCPFLPNIPSIFLQVYPPLLIPIHHSPSSRCGFELLLEITVSPLRKWPLAVYFLGHAHGLGFKIKFDSFQEWWNGVGPDKGSRLVRGIFIRCLNAKGTRGDQTRWESFEVFTKIHIDLHSPSCTAVAFLVLSDSLLDKRLFDLV